MVISLTKREENIRRKYLKTGLRTTHFGFEHQLTGSADVTRGVRGPGDAVNTGAMVVQPCNWSTGHTHIQDDHLSFKLTD